MRNRIFLFLAVTAVVLVLLSGCSLEPTPYAGTLDKEGNELVIACVNDLRSRLGPNSGVIVLIAYEPVIWRDTALGLNEPGKSYAPAVTPGARVVLRTAGWSFTYHAGRTALKIEVKLASQAR